MGGSVWLTAHRHLTPFQLCFGGPTWFPAAAPKGHGSSVGPCLVATNLTSLSWVPSGIYSRSGCLDVAHSAGWDSAQYLVKDYSIDLSQPPYISHVPNGKKKAQLRHNDLAQFRYLFQYEVKSHAGLHWLVKQLYRRWEFLILQVFSGMNPTLNTGLCFQVINKSIIFSCTKLFGQTKAWFWRSSRETC